MHVTSPEIGPPEETITSPSSRPEPPQKKSLPLLVITATAILLVVVGLIAISYPRHPSPESFTLRSSLASSAITLRLTGTTEAVHMRSIVAPVLSSQHFGTMTVTKLAPSGSSVHKGDLLAEFDRQAQIREFIDRQAEYVDLADKTVQAQAKEVADRAKSPLARPSAAIVLNNRRQPATAVAAGYCTYHG